MSIKKQYIQPQVIKIDIDSSITLIMKSKVKPPKPRGGGSNGRNAHLRARSGISRLDDWRGAEGCRLRAEGDRQSTGQRIESKFISYRRESGEGSFFCGTAVQRYRGIAGQGCSLTAAPLYH